MIPVQEIISWSVLFPKTWLPTNWPPQSLQALTDIWVVSTITIAGGLLLWALFRTRQVWQRTSAYLDLASRLASSGDTLRNRSVWSNDAKCPMARDFNELLVEVPNPESPLDKELKRSGCAADVFTTGNLGQGIVSSRLLMATPAILTGLGVLGTFVGLAMGIGGLDLQSQNINNLNQSIAPLIQGCSTAFITSVWGVAASIVFTVLEKALEWLAVWRIQKVQAAFDALVPRYSPEESMLSLQSSSLNLDFYVTGLAGAIGDAMQKAIDRLGNSITKAVKKSLGDNAEDLAGKTAEMMAKAITEQLANLEIAMKGISDQFQTQFGDATQKLTGTISSLETIVSRMDATVKSSQIAVNQAVERLSGHEAVVEALLGGAKLLKDAAEELASMRETFALSADKNKLAATALETAADKNETVANQFDEISKKLPQVQDAIAQGAAVIGSINKPVLDLRDILIKTPDIFKEQSDSQTKSYTDFTTELLGKTQGLVSEVVKAAKDISAIQSLSSNLSDSTNNLNTAAASLSQLSNNIKVASEKHIAAAEASEKAAAAGERAATQLQPLPSSLKEVTNTLTQAGDTIKTAANSSKDSYLNLIEYQKQWFDGVKLGLTSMRDQVQSIIDQYGESVDVQTRNYFNAWTKAVNNALERYSAQITGLEENINHLRDDLEGFNRHGGS